MNEHDLFAAIGSIDNTYLLELEQPKIRRLPKRFGLIAAMLALLLTACAAPAILQHFDALQTGGVVNDEMTLTLDELWEDPEAHGVNGDYLVRRPNTVSLNVTVAKDVPETLVQPCLPLALWDYATLEACTQTETSFSMEFSIKVPRYGQIRGILYQQHVLPKDGRIEIENFIGYGFMNEDMKTYGDISALEIEGRTFYLLLDSTPEQPSYSGHITTKHIFWSDGHYLYCLKLPITYNLPITAVETIVTSLTPVDDITQYLPAE